MKNCPCGSNKNYNDCCGVYIAGCKNPETPEQLMRSRYTAYTQANFDYIKKTMKAHALNLFNLDSAKQSTTTVQWLGLEVLHCTTDKTKGYVEFIAHFNQQGKKDCIHEISEFHQLNGQWYYVDGKHKQTKYHSREKI